MREMSQTPMGILPQQCLPPWLLAGHQDDAHGVFPWLCLRKYKGGKKASHSRRTRPRSDWPNLQLGLRSIQHKLGFFGLFAEQKPGLHINSDRFRLAPWTFARNRGKMAVTSLLS